jgi:hypothetical protein
VYALAALILAIAAARCAPDSAMSSSRPLTSATDDGEPAPYQGWWKQYQE